MRQQVAEKLGLPEHHVRVIKQHMGGGFGSKQIAWKHDVIAALLSKPGGPPGAADARPRGGEPGGRQPQPDPAARPARREARRHADRDRRPTSSRLPAPTAPAARRATSAACTRRSTAARTCAPSRPPSTPTPARPSPSAAPGHVEAAFALEQAMDELARALDMDPVELRRRNYAEVDQLEDKPLHARRKGCVWLRPGHRGLRLARLAARRSQRTAPKRRGVGFAAHDWVGGAGHPPGYAWVELNTDGTRRRGHRHPGHRHRHPHRPGPDRRRGARAAARARRAPPGRHRYRAVRAGQLRQRHPGDASARPSAPPPPTPRRSCSRPPRTLLEVDAARLTLRDGEVLVDGERRAARWPIAEVTQKIAPHMIQGRGARGPNPTTSRCAPSARSASRSRSTSRPAR